MKTKKLVAFVLILLAILVIITTAHVPARAQSGYQTAPFNPTYSGQMGPVSLPSTAGVPLRLEDLLQGGNTAVGTMPDGNLIYRTPEGQLRILFLSADTNVPYIQSNGGGGTENPGPSPETGTPGTQPTPTPSNGASLRSQMVRLVDAARELIPTIRRLVEKPMLPLMIKLAWILASFIMVISYLRILRENNGLSMDFYFWTGRAIFFMFMIGVSTSMVFYLARAGTYITTPLDSTTTTLQVSFDEKYREFMEGHFTVRDGNKVWVEPMENGKPGLIGILYDKDRKLKDPSEAFEISSWEMPKLFALISFTRSLLEFADFFLIIAGAFVIIFLRIAAPTMCALAIDQKLAQQTTYPYVWTVAAFTLVYPLIREIIRIIAYLMGNLALSTYDGQPMYWMDERTGQIITQAGVEPTFTVFIAAFTMMVTALSMFLAPFIAYKYLKGQVFEAVSSVTSGWMASIIGSGVELYGLRASAAINQQAGTITAEGQFRSESTRALGQKESADTMARARQIVGVANARGNLIATQAGYIGAQTTQRMLADVQNTFGRAQTGATTSLNKSEIAIRRDQNIAGFGAANQRDQFNFAGEASAQKREWWGRTIQSTGTQISPAAEGLGAIAGIPISTAGSITEYTAIGIRNRTQRTAGNDYANVMTGVERNAAGKLTGAQDTYQQSMNSAFDAQTAGTKQAIDAGTSIAIGGANAGAATSIAGINQGYQLELNANRTVYDSTIKGAEISRDAQLDAVKLQALSHVVSMFFRDVSRKMESGLTPRY